MYLMENQSHLPVVDWLPPGELQKGADIRGGTCSRNGYHTNGLNILRDSSHVDRVGLVYRDVCGTVMK
jgi:hypothetical protein